MGIDPFLADKTFLITGSTGRLGVDISARLEDLGAEIIPLVTPGYPEKPERTDWKANTSPVMWEDADLDKYSPDYVINLHWRVNRNLKFSDQLLFETDYNVTRLDPLWSTLKKKQPGSSCSVKNFVNISSIKVYSSLNNKIISSYLAPKPNTPYGIIKLAAENFFDSYFNSNFPVSHIRLCSVASAGEHPSQLMSRLFNSAFNGERIEINSNIVCNLLYIDEAVDLIINAAIQGKQAKYNLVPESRQEFMNKDIAYLFEDVSGKELNAEFVDLNPGLEKQFFISDIEQLKHDWVRTYSMKEIIEKVISANKDHHFNKIIY